MPPAVSVVIPVFRSEQSLPLLVERLYTVLARRGAPFEIILVNDDSPDGSWEVIRRLARRWPGVSGVALSRNYGQHNALLCGIRRARHEVIVTLDDDLQHPPEQVPQLLERLTDEVDVVYGTPQRERHGLWRDGASVLLKWALRHVVGADTARQVSAFRAFRTRLRDGFAGYSSSYVSIDVLLTWATTRFAAVAVPHEPRRLGRSGYTFRKLVSHALNLLTGFSVAPLRLAGLIGAVTTGLGLAALTFALVRALLAGTAVPGFLFLASLITVFSGTQLFALGVLGEYLGRMYLRTMERPVYLVSEETNEAGPAVLPGPFTEGPHERAV
jgi:undecaprenyl-phosphate 4-deoxy-4-formamido-L-arabinose transferase